LENTGRNRTKKKEVCFTEQELEYVMERVTQSGLDSFQSFALHMLIVGDVTTIDYSELRRLNGEINKIGTNVNQIIKLAHLSNNISSQDVQNLTQVLQNLTSLVNDKFKSEIKISKSGFKSKDPTSHFDQIAQLCDLIMDYK